MGYVITGNKMEFTPIPSLPYTNNGVTWSSPSANHFHAQGRASGNSLMRLVDTMNIPSWLEYDKQYNIYFDRTGNTNRVVCYIELQKNSDLSWLTVFYNYQDGSFTIPAEPQGYRQLGVSLRVSNRNTANETVHPYLIKTVPYTPRLSRYSPTNMSTSPYYQGTYAGYPYIPNCTRYCYGRWWEIMGNDPTGLAYKGDAEMWWDSVTAYAKGQTPRLGAIICFADGPYSHKGHVGVVEQIDADGTVHFSNSGYTRSPNKWNQLYFYTKEGKASNNYGYERGYIFQGFIYLPDEYSPPDEPPTPDPNVRRKPLWFWTRRKPF